ncbi:hypothetical protein Pfo_016210 [Paulownia fortunei]|nr:hypothetical protein Pfo_016210 [Paulownia fortunei]
MTSVSIISAVAAWIKHLLDESKHSQSWRNDAEKLLSGLERLNPLLKAADQETKQSKQFVELEKRIVQLSYEIDDAIAASELVFPSKPRGRISGMLVGNSERSSKADLESLTTNLVNITKNLELEIQKERNSVPGQTSHQSNPVSPTASTGEDLPRMENEVRAALLKQDLPVVCVWGNSGMGKTTLAKKAFYHAEVRRYFQVFAWVPMNQDFQTKNVLQAILLQLLPDRKVDIRGMDEIELAQQIFKVQKEKRCLVVLEDIGAVQDWQSIRIAFPIGHSVSKILITTPFREVAEEATSAAGVYSMRPLTEAECLKLLREKASFDDRELLILGKTIFSLSGGSPLITVILGKSLKTVDVAARDQLLQELDSYLSRSHSDGETQVLGLSYHRLPHELKPCLLYMGQFPEGQDIEVEKLYLLLAAEDLVSPEDSGRSKTISMESVRNIMEKLALKRLVEVQEDKVSMTRMYKSCRLHDKIREFCISKGLDEEFFEIVDLKSGKKLRPSTRRLAIYLSKYGDEEAIQFSSQDMMKKIRSILIFDTYESQQKSTWPSEINDLKEFSRLRVLDFDGVDFRFRKFPRGIDKLVFLRYLSFRGCCLEDFPSSISNFPWLETLDLRVTDCKMTIPNVLSNMKRLRHLYFPTLYESDGSIKLQLHGLERLEILVNFDTGACNVEDLFQMKNLQILTTISEGNPKDLEAIIEFLDKKAANLQQSSLDIRNFDCYTRDRATIFKKLLECKSLHSLHIEGQIGELPKDVAISSNFTEMVFNGSELEADPMNALGKVENLRSLILSNDAFVGNELSFSAASKFPNLRSLKLQNLQYLEKLTFEKGAMPKLSTLVIDKCDYLEKVLMPKALDNRLQLAQGKKGGDVYSVEPLPTIIS